MHAAQRPLLVVEGHVGLRDHRLQPVVLELVLAEGAGEEPARILAALDVDDERALQLGFRENHLDHFPFVFTGSQSSTASNRADVQRTPAGVGDAAAAAVQRNRASSCLSRSSPRM